MAPILYVLCHKNQSPKPSVKRLSNCTKTRIPLETDPPVRPTSPTPKNNTNKIKLIIALGNPRTEPCGAFNTLVQFSALLTLHSKLTCGFFNRFNFSINCIKDAIAPMLEPNTIRPYLILSELLFITTNIAKISPLLKNQVV